MLHKYIIILCITVLPGATSISFLPYVCMYVCPYV